jgi:hypothetical protein
MTFKEVRRILFQVTFSQTLTWTFAAMAEVTAAVNTHKRSELASSEAMSSLVRDLAGNNALISVALTGVMLLQVGSFFAKPMEMVFTS